MVLPTYFPREETLFAGISELHRHVRSQLFAGSLQFLLQKQLPLHLHHPARKYNHNHWMHDITRVIGCQWNTNEHHENLSHKEKYRVKMLQKTSAEKGIFSNWVTSFQSGLQ